MPGSRDEMHQFEEHTKDHSSYVIKCFLPVVKIHLPNKQFFSTLFHRLVLFQSLNKLGVARLNVLRLAILVVVLLWCRFGQDLPMWQSSLSKKSDQSSIYSPPSSLVPVGDPLTDTIRPHLLAPQPSFKPLHREGL